MSFAMMLLQGRVSIANGSEAGQGRWFRDRPARGRALGGSGQIGRGMLWSDVLARVRVASARDREHFFVSRARRAAEFGLPTLNHGP